MLHSVALVRTDSSEERIVSIIRVTRIAELGTTLSFLYSYLRLLVIANVVAISPILVTLMTKAIRSLETSVLARTTRLIISENDILHVRFEVFTAVTMKNGVFWDVTPCGSCKNRRFGRT
jgi:hypothetical protein